MSPSLYGISMYVPEPKTEQRNLTRVSRDPKNYARYPLWDKKSYSLLLLSPHANFTLTLCRTVSITIDAAPFWPSDLSSLLPLVGRVSFTATWHGSGHPISLSLFGLVTALPSDAINITESKLSKTIALPFSSRSWERTPEGKPKPSPPPRFPGFLSIYLIASWVFDLLVHAFLESDFFVRIFFFYLCAILSHSFFDSWGAIWEP